MKLDDFITTLIEELPNSSDDQRQEFAKFIIQQSIDLSALNKLLFEEKSIALKYSWLLSNIGIESPTYLYNFLSELLALSKKVSSFDFELSMINYWRIAGIPPSDEGYALTKLFDWTLSSSTNSTMKDRAFKCLIQLYEKHPHIKGELIHCLESQKDLYSKSFRSKVEKMISQL